MPYRIECMGSRWQVANVDRARLPGTHYAECPVCHRMFSVSARGTLQPHGATLEKRGNILALEKIK